MIDLKYGSGTIKVDVDEARWEILQANEQGPALSDVDIGRLLDSPLDSPPLEDIVCPGDSVLLVVPDATRQSGSAQIVNLLVRRLIANGTAPHDIRIIFATGIHRKVTAGEKAAILTPFIVQRIKTLDHDPRDLMQIVDLGVTTSGIKIGLNRALVEHDHVVIVGGVTFHYFAGFTGGRKLICPGLASSRTVSETHKLAFDCATSRRRDGVDTGLLQGNAVHENFVEVVEQCPPALAINTIVNDLGQAVELVCGNWKSSHAAACGMYARSHKMRLNKKRELVIVSCGGFPNDINLIQAHKALDAASRACLDGGTIILLAECRDGLGRDDFLKWFDAGDTSVLAKMLCEKYQVNGQTAWSLLEKAERFQIKIVTTLPDEALSSMRLARAEPAFIDSLASGGSTSGYILPEGAKLHFES